MESSNNTHKDAWDWRTRIPNNVHIVHAGPNTGFFKRWCNVMRLMVPMTDRELDVISSFLKHRWELSKVISDPAVLDSQLMSNDIRDKIIEDCGITRQYFYVLKSGLIKNHIIINDKINPKLIPNIKETDNGVFQFLMLFKDDVDDEI